MIAKYNLLALPVVDADGRAARHHHHRRRHRPGAAAGLEEATAEDLPVEEASMAPPPDTRRRPRLPAASAAPACSIFLAVMGPGLIAAASDNDAGGITTWSVIGAQLRLQPALAAAADHARSWPSTQEMGARMGVVTGKGLAALIRETLQPQDHGLRHARPADRQLRHHGGRVLGRRGGLQPRPRAALGVRAAGRRGRLAAGHARLVPQVERVFLRLYGRLRRPTSSPASSPARTGARPLHGTVVPSIQSNSLLDPHRDRRHRHHDHALGPVLHPGLRRRQEGLDQRSTSTPSSRSTSAPSSPTPSTSSSSSPAPRRSTSTASWSTPPRTPPGRSSRSPGRGGATCSSASAC